MKDSNSGFMKISKDQYSSLKPLNFNIGSETYALTPNGQIWPRALNSALGGTDDDVFLVIADVSILLVTMIVMDGHSPCEH